MGILDDIGGVLANVGGTFIGFAQDIGNLINWIKIITYYFFYVILWVILVVMLLALITSPIWVTNLINRIGEKYRNFNLGDLFTYSMAKVYQFFK